MLGAVVNESEAAGRALTLAEIGERMQQCLGVDAYQAMAREPLRTLVAKHGWIVTQEQVGRLVIRRPESAG